MSKTLIFLIFIPVFLLYLLVIVEWAKAIRRHQNCRVCTGSDQQPSTCLCCGRFEDVRKRGRPATLENYVPFGPSCSECDVQEEGLTWRLHCFTHKKCVSEPEKS